MRFTIPVLLAALASASPVAEAEAAPAPQYDDPKPVELVDFWFEKNFLGIKITGIAKVNECKTFPKDFDNQVSSAKARDHFLCSLYVDPDCKGLGFTFDKNGVKVLPAWIDDKASSWKCFEG